MKKKAKVLLRILVTAFVLFILFDLNREDLGFIASFKEGFIEGYFGESLIEAYSDKLNQISSTF